MGRFIACQKSCHREAGYSLIGATLFIVVLGLLIAGGLSLKQQYDWSKRQEVTATNMATVKEALMRYQSQNGRLPCPASLGDAPDSATFGREQNCTSAAVSANTFRDQGRGGRNIRYGAVPVRTLGLPDSVLVDGWNHRLVYAVTEYYAGPSNTIDPDFDNGAIAIVDPNGTNTTNVGGNVIYTVMAPGADERGAYTMAGTLIDPCVGTNCTAGDGTLQLSIFRQYNTRTSASNNDFTATMTYEASSESYEWREGPWSACGCARPTTRTIGKCDINWGRSSGGSGHSGGGAQQNQSGILNVDASPGSRTPPCIGGSGGNRGGSYSSGSNSRRGGSSSSSSTYTEAKESCCANPTRTRTVTCHVRGSDAVVNDNRCATSVKPATTQPCAQFCWAGPTYPRCPTGCGKPASIKYAPAATRLCKENINKTVPYGACVTANMPSLIRWCPATGPCPPPPSPNPGGGWVDTDGDGRGDTHIRDMPNGTSGPSSSTPGGAVNDGNSSKDAQGNYGGSVDGGSTGWNPE